jgi:hypothetical protein
MDNFHRSAAMAFPCPAQDFPNQGRCLIPFDIRSSFVEVNMVLMQVLIFQHQFVLMVDSDAGSKHK